MEEEEEKIEYGGGGDGGGGIHPKNCLSWMEKSGENSNFLQKNCIRTRKLSILQCVRTGQQASLKTKVC